MKYNKTWKRAVMVPNIRTSIFCPGSDVRAIDRVKEFNHRR